MWLVQYSPMAGEKFWFRKEARNITGACLRLLTILSLGVCAVAHASADPRLWLNNLQTLQAQYEQSLMSAEGDTLQTSEGSLSLQTKPLRMYIQEKKPTPLKIVFDGHTLWQYDVELNEITQYPRDSLAEAPLLVLFENPNWGDWKWESSKLTPPKNNEHFRSIRLDLKENNPERLQITLKNGEVIDYSFKEAQYNKSLPKNQFAKPF